MLYNRLPPVQRQRLHQRIAARLEAGYGDQVRDIAAELAVHWERGRDYQRAVHYRRQAADNALRRHAHRETISHLTVGLELLRALPDTPERTQQELDLQIALGPALMATRGYAAPEVEQTYARARALCAQVEETPQLFPTLRGLWRFYRSRGALPTAQEFGEHLVRLAQREADPTHLLEAHEALGQTLYLTGDYVAARMHLEEGSALTDPTTQRAQALRLGEASGMRCLAVAASVLWCLGYPAQAMRRSQEALVLAQEIAHPYSLTVARYFAALLHHHHRAASAVQAQALTVLEANGQGEWLAEVYRLQGALLLRQTAPDAAQVEACFHQALAIARRQQAQSWELRAAMGLARLWHQQGKRNEARELLAEV